MLYVQKEIPPFHTMVTVTAHILPRVLRVDMDMKRLEGSVESSVSDNNTHGACGRGSDQPKLHTNHCLLLFISHVDYVTHMVVTTTRLISLQLSANAVACGAFSDLTLCVICVVGL